MDSCVKKLTPDRLREALHYNPETGEVRWAKKVARTVVTGRLVCTKTMNGYLRVRLDKTDIALHRAAWVIYYGKYPDGVIDHIDGDKKNNRIENLRCVSVSVNTQNQRSAMRHNKCGFLGVTHEKQTGKFKAAINIGLGKSKTLGRFNTAEEAHAAYVNAKRVYHAGCTI